MGGKPYEAGRSQWLWLALWRAWRPTMQPDRRTEHARRIAAMRREMDERETRRDQLNLMVG